MNSLSAVSDDLLKNALVHQSSFIGVCKALELKYSSYIRAAIRKRAARLGFDCNSLSVRVSPFSEKDALEHALKGARSYRDVLRNLGCPISGKNAETLKKYLALFKLDTSHVKNGNSRGAVLCANVRRARRTPLAELLVENSPASRSTIKRRILEEGLLPYRCTCCSNEGTWAGKPLTLALEHKNGIGDDHRLENLEFLCPNCHSQTPTFAGRNVKKGSDEREHRRAKEEELRRARRQEQNDHVKPIRLKRKRNTDGQRKRWLERQEPRLAALRAAGVDFSKHGWVTQAAAIINLSPQKVSAWLKKVDSELYATCKHRKAPSRPLGQPAANDADASPLHLAV